MRPSLLAAAALIAGSAPGLAQPTPANPRFAVGFRLIHELDHSRAIGPTRDFEGKPRTGDIAVPMQIGVWYPAAARPIGPHVTRGDFALMSMIRGGARPLTRADSDAARTDLKSFAKFALRQDLTDADVNAVFGLQLEAVRDAPAAAGRFPVVIAGTDGALSGGIQYFETLASRGFVVVAAPSRAALGALQVTKPAWVMDARIRDLEYLTAYARQFSFADPSRVVMMGINFDGMAALLYQMKNMRAMGVVSIDGWEGKQGNSLQVRASPFYDPLRMRVPYFVAQQDELDAPPPLQHDFTVFNALRYAAAEHLVLHGMSHAYLVGSAALYPATPAQTKATQNLLLERIARFVDAAVKGETTPTVASDPPQVKEHRRHEALAAVPFAEEVEEIVMAPGGAERLRSIHREARRYNPDLELVTPTALNLFAFRMTRMERPADAMILRELGTEVFPKSAAAQNDLGNAQLQAADTSRAIQAFERALALVPEDTSLTDPERAQYRTVIQTKIDRLRRRP